MGGSMQVNILPLQKAQSIIQPSSQCLTAGEGYLDTGRYIWNKIFQRRRFKIYFKVGLLIFMVTEA